MEYQLKAEPRAVTGKKVKRLRQEGLTPIVVYGAGVEPVALQTPTKDLLRVLSQAGGTQIIVLDVTGEREARMTLVREVQRHVTRLTPLHADFLQVDMAKLLSSSIPLQAAGEPELVRQNAAILQMPLNAVMVEALPGDLPPAIQVDLTGLVDFDGAIYVRDLDAGEAVRILNDPDELVARLTPAIEEVMEEVEEELVAPEEMAAEAEAEPEAEAKGEAAETEAEAED
jgi:large subunit ribosomal protein L25